MRSPIQLLAFFGLLALAAFMPHSVHAQTPRDLSGAVGIAAAEEISNLDRATMRVVSSVAVRLTNQGTAPLEVPLHAVVEFTTQGDRTQIRLEGAGALGGFGEEPYGLPYLDLSGLLPQGGLPVGEAVSFTLRFSRPSTLFATYKVVPHGVMNRPPLAVLDGPGEAAAETPVRFGAGFSSDPDGDELEFGWEFGDGTSGEGSQVEHAYARPGVYDVTLRARDAKGLEARATRTVLAVPAGQFALGRARALDADGLPLAGVTVTEFAPGGVERSFEADADGYAVLGGDEGFYRWRFAKPGHVTVWRTGELVGGRVALVPSPWLTPEVVPETAAGPLAGLRLAAADNSLALEFPAGAFSQPGLAGLTVLHGQALPLPLPRGWSPLAGLAVRGPGELLASGVLGLAAAPPAGTTACLLRYDPTVPRWVAADTEAPFEVDAFGTWAVALADGAPTAPPPPVAGEELAGLAVGSEGPVTAEGRLEPPQRTASLDPALVKTAARVGFRGEGSLASGRMFRARINETYRLRGGAVIPSPEYDTTVFAYRGADGAADQVAAEFPLRPLRLFGPAELESANVRVELLEATDYQAVVLGAEGGSLAAGSLRLALAPGALAARTVAELRLLDPSSFVRLLGGLTGGGMAFQLGYGGGAELEVAVAGLQPDGHFVLARVVAVGGREGLQPVLRLAAGADGVARSAEPASGPRLPGLVAGGTYVLVGVGVPQGLVRGRVLGVDGTPRAAMPVEIPGAPWLAGSGAGDGRFLLVAGAGEGTAQATDPADGNTGEAAFAMADVAAGVEIEIVLRETGPRVVTLEPADGATGVRTVSPVVARFSEPLDPAVFGPSALTVREEGAAVAVAGSLSLAGDGMEAAFLAASPLAAGKTYLIELAATIRDRQGLELEGPREFRFTTLPPENRGEAGQLVIYEPGAAGPTPAHRALIDAIPGYEPGRDREKVVAIGSPGTADPNVPVILVNESTGATATVVSKADGSFANFIEASEDDFIAAVFVNANGTRISVPATRQLFDDGRVGLYRQGGILEAESDGGPVQVIVEPQSVTTRTVFRLGRISTNEVLDLVGGTQPDEGRILGGINFQEEGELTRTYSDLVFPVKIADLGLSPGVDPAQATFALTVPRKINGNVVYDIIDGMTFRPTGPGEGELVTQSPPFVGLLLREIAALRAATGLRDGLKEVSRVIADGAVSTLLPVGIMAVPILMAEISGTNLHGTVFVQTPPPEGAPPGTQPTRAPLAGAVIRLGPSQVQLLPDVFTAGTLVTTSDREGKYALRLPSVISKAVAATHRRFPGQTVRTGVANGGIISGTRADFIFFGTPTPDLAIDDNSPPQISISQLSLLATIGEQDDAGLVLDEVISDDLRIAVETATGPKLESFTTLIGNDVIDLPEDEIALLEGEKIYNDQTGLPTILHRQWQVRSKRAGRAIYVFEASDKDPVGGVEGEDAAPVNASPPTQVRYTVVFTTAAGSPPPPDQGLPPRVVSFAWPPDAALAANGTRITDVDDMTKVARGTPLRLRFSRPLSEAEVARLVGAPSEGGGEGGGEGEGGAAGNGGGPWLVVEGDGAQLLHVNVAPDRREITVAYWLSDPTVEKIDFVITDLAVAVANPTGATPDGAAAAGGQANGQFRHTLAFGEQPTIATGADATLGGSFGGIVHQGAHVWALERGMEGGKLLHYKIAKEGTNARLELQTGDTFEFREGNGGQSGDGRPMDLVLVPGYALRLPEGAPREDTYLVVFAGPIQGNDPGAPAPKRAHIFKISTTGKPEPFLVRGDSPVLASSISQITRGRWDPPFLSYLEIGDTTSVSLLTLNGLAVEALDRKRFLPVPPDRVDGVDLNNDGDFADDGERAPNRGLEFSWAPLDPNERVVDYDFSADFGLMGAVLRPLGAGDHVFAMILGGDGQVDDLTARVAFPHAAKRMKILPRQRLIRPSGGASEAANQLFAGTNDQEVVRDIAIVSCINSNPDGARSLLLVIDINDPRAPVLLAEAPLPLGIGTLNSIVPRGDGLLAVSATGGGLFLLDPTLLLITGPDGNSAAIRQQIQGLESNVSTFSSGADGLSFANFGTTIRTAVTEPTITVLKPRFRRGEGALNSAKGIVNVVRTTEPTRQLSRWYELLGNLEPTGLGGNAGLFDDENPDDPQRHFYVVVQAPGLAANAQGELPLAAAAVSSTGRPLLPSMENRAPTFVGEESVSTALAGFAALKAAHFLADIDFNDDPASIALSLANKIKAETVKNFLDGGIVKAFLDGSPDYAKTLTAHRLSDDPTSPLFNTYVAGPIVLLHRDAKKEFVAKDNPLGRVALRASPFYWVGLAPTLGPDRINDPFLAAFASKQADNLEITPDVTPGKLKNVADKAVETLTNPVEQLGGPILAVSQIALQLSTLVDAEFERTFEPGHNALVNFGFRRNPVIFVPGVMASHLINPGVEGPASQRWLSLASSARAHARELVSELNDRTRPPEFIRERLCQIEDRLNARINDLIMERNGDETVSRAALDTQDILRTVGLGDIAADLAADGVISSFFRFVSAVASFFGTDLGIGIDPQDPLVKHILNKINSPVYEPLLLYLNAYLGMDEYKNSGRGEALRLDGKPNWKSLRAGPEFFVFPYDWRLDNRTNAEKLKKYVDLIQTVHPDAAKVDILCHSMGGLVARNFVLENAHRVDRFISINSPYLGATKALNAMKTGDMGELSMRVFMPEPRMRIVTRHMPAVHQLLPNRGLLELGLPVLQENGWDLDGDGSAYGNLNYEGYKNALDGSFFRVPPDEIENVCAGSASQELDRRILQSQPQPISRNNEPFHTSAQYDWRGDGSGVRYTHFVSLQNQPGTITGLSARAALIPEALKPDISLSLPPVGVFESEQEGGDAPIVPDVPRPIETDPEKTFRVTWFTDVVLGGGDGTVPFLSQARGYGSAGSLNARHALMFPILNPKPPEDPAANDKLAGHNDCMRNPQLWAWVGKALQDEIVRDSQPTLTISGGGGAENQPLTFTANLSNTSGAETKPTGRAASLRRLVWDMGDGTVLHGESATHVYRRPGTYTVTCALAYEPGALESAPGAGDPPPKESMRQVSRRPAFGAVASLQVVISNDNPAPVIAGPDRPVAGLLATYRLDMAGRGSDDGRRFEWSFDGIVDPGNDSKYVVQHVFPRTGEFDVKVKVINDDGTSAEATKTVTVGLAVPAPAPAAPVARSAAPVPAPQDEGEAPEVTTEMVSLTVTGHSADSDDIIIRNDGKLVRLGTRVATVQNGQQLEFPGFGFPGSTAQIPAAQTITVARFPKNVATTTITLTGDRPRLLARGEHFKVGSPLKCWYHRFGFKPAPLVDKEIVFTISWNDLPALTSENVRSVADDQNGFILLEGGVLAECDERGPVVNAALADRTQEGLIQADDNTTVVGAPVGDGSDQPTEDAKLHVGLPWPPGAPLPGQDPDLPAEEGVFGHPLEDSQVSRATTQSATLDAVPGGVVPEDRGGRATPTDGKDSPEQTKELTDADITGIQNAVKLTFQEVAQMATFKKMVFGIGDLLILEQGSGALLWKATSGGPAADLAREKLQGVYVRGSSDNDYEIFLPVFKNQDRTFDYDDPQQAARFAFLAHTPDHMFGDWYFKRPRGQKRVGGQLLDLGPAPDPVDADAYERYVAATDEWKYDVPVVNAVEVETLEAGWDGLIPKGFLPFGDGKTPFNAPATPAEVISFLLTETVKRNEQRKKEFLPDVSFFPFRKEHLLFANLSLEKPAPFGDDPVGDSGMGRQLLLLKWVLEGAFLPPFVSGLDKNFNAGVDDLTLRNEIYDRLVLRKREVDVEGFEWGIYHQWANLRDGVHFRVRPRGTAGPDAAALRAREQCRQVFGNYLDSHDDKVMKKVGKAAIRAILGRLAAESAERDKFFETDPEEFDNNADYRSFEHFVADIAKRAVRADPSLLQTAGPDDIDLYLGAKVGDRSTFRQIRQTIGVDEFVFRGQALLAEVQEDTASTYAEALGRHLLEGRVVEFDMRRNNARVIEHGFSAFGQERRPGRAELAGLVGGTHELEYEFVVNVQRNTTTTSPGEFRIRLEPKAGDNATAILVPTPPNPGLTFKPDELAITIKNKGPTAGLVLRRPAADARTGERLKHNIAIAGNIPAESNSEKNNDKALLESDVMLPPLFRDPDLVPAPGNRIVYRGMRLSTDRFEDVKRQQFEAGVLFAPYRFFRDANGDPISLQKAKDMMLVEFESKIAADPDIFSPLFDPDFDIMPLDQILAVAHTGHTAPPFPNPDFSPYISTAEHIETAINFALEKENDVRLLLAIEVPDDQGFRFVETATPSLAGRNLQRRLNDEEGLEIAFLDDLRFIRCHVYEVIANGSLDFTGPWELRFIRSYGPPFFGTP